MTSPSGGARRLQHLALAGAFLSIVFLPPAHADGPRLQQGPVLPSYQRECGSCHLAYPAGLLPASSWRRIIDGLDRHFGTDASLDTQSTRQIGAWLQAHAAERGRLAALPAQDRITRSAWFERTHRRIDASVWQSASVKTAANCAACHAGAAQDDFDEERLRIPPGLDARQRRAFRDD
jgi:Dihaem cytochrome c